MLRHRTADPIAAPEGSNLLVEVDLALDLKRETDPAECYRRLCREPLVALEFTVRQTLSYCLLNLALGSHTQPLEKLADAGVENVFVHRRLHVAALVGLNDFKKTGYGGPCPPIGRHRYFHKLYALDITLDLRDATKSQIERAMQGHILANAELIGTYQKGDR